jgi:ABC-2 type transport system permease protein
MKGVLISLQAEVLKIYRSRVFWVSIAFFAFVPCMMGLLMFVQKYPGISAKLGMIGTKSTMVRFGEPNWTNYLTLISESVAAIGLIGYGFVTAWSFGREYTDRTIKDILSLPVPRGSIVMAKFAAITLWSILLSFVFLLVALVIGKVIQLTGWSDEVIMYSLLKFTFTSLLTILLLPPVAFFACYGKGVLLPMGFVILTLLMANFTGLVGLGPYFPWAIPGIFSTTGGAGGSGLFPVSYIILITTGLAGLAATLAWWQFADHK